MRIAIFGLGYVGVTAAACLAHEGHDVLGIDTNETKVKAINSGRSPIVEPLVGEMLERAVSEKRLAATTDGSDELNSCEVAMVCVGTPSAPDGSHDLSSIAEVSRQIARYVSFDRKKPLTVVYRSTIRPGTIEKIIQPIYNAILGAETSAISLVYNPEFLREATAVSDYFDPPKIVIGTADAKPNVHLDAIYQNIPSRRFYTNFREAEITKFVDNSFHALKVAFANEIGRLSLQLGISPMKVHEIFVSDTKLNISSKYFRPGGAFGGSCLPKDVRALQHIADELGATTPIISGLIHSNEAHKDFTFEYVTRGLSVGSSVLMLGLAFKKGSDDLRESPKVDLAKRLSRSGYKLSIYEPALEPSSLVGQNLGYSFTHLPGLLELLISKVTCEQESFDLVIDTSGLATSLSLSSKSVLDISRLS